MSERSKHRLRQRVKELTPRNRGVSMGYVISEINVYLKGWSGFFGICTTVVERTLKGVDAHTRRRLRAMKLKQRKRKRFILGYLVKMGANKARAGKQVFSGRKSIWKLSHIPAVEGVLNNAYWAKQGLVGSVSFWKASSERIKASAFEQMTLCLD